MWLILVDIYELCVSLLRLIALFSKWLSRILCIICEVIVVERTYHKLNQWEKCDVV